MTANLYLYTGPEFGERSEAVESVRKAFKKKFGEIDEYSYYLIETPFNEIMTTLQSGSLFSSGVFIVCKNAELLKKKEEMQMISDWINLNQDSAVLILISDEVTVDAKLEKLCPPSNRKKFYEMFEEKKLPWINNYFRKNGWSIEENAAQLILDMVENNTQSLKNECSRFFVLFPKDHQITETDVESVLANTKEETAFTLFNEIADSSQDSQIRLEKGLSILQKILLTKDNSSIATSTIAGLTSCFRKLVLWHDEGENAIHGTLMQKQYRKAAKIWSKGQATAILAVLASADMEIRSGGAALEEIILQKMLYEIVIKKGGSIAVWED